MPSAADFETPSNGATCREIRFVRHVRSHRRVEPREPPGRRLGTSCLLPRAVPEQGWLSGRTPRIQELPGKKVDITFPKTADLFAALGFPVQTALSLSVQDPDAAAGEDAEEIVRNGSGTGEALRTLAGVESSLNERVRSGEREAFAEIFDQHARVVYAHALRTTGDWAAAEDVMSLTFLEAWRLRAKLRGEVVSVRPWLLGIATNVLRNRARKARRHRDAMSRLPPHHAFPDIADEVVGQLADTERLAAAATALRRLKRSEREVFSLIVWSGLDYSAAAEALGIPTGTVRSRLSRARNKLRRLVEAELRPGADDMTPPPAGRHPAVDSPAEALATQRKTR